MTTFRLRRGTAGLLGLFVLVGMVPGHPVAQAATQKTFWVAPPNDPTTPGSDTNVGDQQHPFATLNHARQLVNSVRAGGTQTGDIVVNIGPGTYYTPAPVEFTDADSGTGGFQVIYRNAPGSAVGSARFVGGNPVTSAWNLVTAATGSDAALPASAAGRVYKTNVGTGTPFNTLYVDGTRATTARTPNRTVDPRFPSALGGYFNATGGGMTSLVYSATDLPNTSASIKGLTGAQQANQLDAQLVAWDYGKAWMTDTIPLGSVNTSTRTLAFKAVAGHPELNRPKYPMASGSRYFVQGNLGFLDAPGEYYYNKTTGDLYYYPVNGADPNQQSIVVPATESILWIAGASRTKQASNITFDGLAFEGTDFPDYYSYGWNWGDAGAGMGTYPPEATGATLPSYSESTERVEFQTGNIVMTNASRITVTNAHIKNAGMFGVELYLGVDHVTVSNSLIEATGHGGVNVEGGYPGTGGDASGNGYTTDNTVTNSLIHDVGQLVGQTAGITINNATATTVSNNEIYNSPRRGLFIMGGWPRNTGTTTPNDKGYNRMTDLYAHHNVFTRNYLHDLQQDGGDDGGFFCAMLYRGTDGATANRVNTIDQMLIDDVGSNPSMADYAPNDLNLDMGCSGFTISNLKAVNPQNFNAELMTIEQYSDVISLTNTNIDYGSAVNQLATFDDTKMDYANIGLTASFPNGYRPQVTTPVPPSNVYFQDAFESGLDLTKWTYRGAAPQISTEFIAEGVLGGKRSLQLDSDNSPAGAKPVLVRDFGQPLQRIVTVDFFDRQSSVLATYNSGVPRPTTVRSFARADDGQRVVGLGVDTAVSSTAYVLQNGSTQTATTVPRTYGWHRFTWDYTGGTGATVSIDGTVVGTVGGLAGVSRLELGNADGKGITFYDRVSVHGGTGTGTAPALPGPSIDLAQNAPATASTVETSSFPASNATDGNPATRWSSQYADPTWLQVDLGSVKTFNRVVLAWEAAYGKNYQIQTSTDGTTWTTVATRTGGSGGTDTLSGFTAGGRYVRMYGTARGTSWGYSLYSFQVYDDGAAKTGVVLRAHANGAYVTAASGGASPLIANSSSVGQWSVFDVIDKGNGDIALRAHANGKYVCADNGGASPLIANRTAVGPWETYKLIHNADGSVSLKSLSNDRYVTAADAGASPLIANRTAIGPWEEFDLVAV